MTGAIFCDTLPAIIIRSAWRGEGRNTSIPKRAMSKREAPMDIISMAQQARPKLIGHSEDFRAQLMAQSRVVAIMPSPPGCRESSGTTNGISAGIEASPLYGYNSHTVRPVCKPPYLPQPNLEKIQAR